MYPKFVVVDGFLISMQTSLDRGSNERTDHGLFVLSKNLRVGLVLSSFRVVFGSDQAATLLLRLDTDIPRTTEALLRLPPLASMTDRTLSLRSSARVTSVIGAGRKGPSPIMDRRAPLESLVVPAQAFLDMSLSRVRH